MQPVTAVSSFHTRWAPFLPCVGPWACGCFHHKTLSEQSEEQFQEGNWWFLVVFHIITRKDLFCILFYFLWILSFNIMRFRSENPLLQKHPRSECPVLPWLRGVFSSQCVHMPPEEGRALLDPNPTWRWTLGRGCVGSHCGRCLGADCGFRKASAGQTLSGAGYEKGSFLKCNWVELSGAQGVALTRRSRMYVYSWGAVA